jgi:hypothetical protein
MDIFDLRREAAENEFSSYCFSGPGDENGWVVKDSGNWTCLPDRLRKPVYFENDFEAGEGGHFPSIKAEFIVIFKDDGAEVDQACCELDGEAVGCRGGAPVPQLDNPEGPGDLEGKEAEMTGLIDPDDIIGYRALEKFALEFASMRPDVGPASNVLEVMLRTDKPFVAEVKDMWVLTYNCRDLSAEVQDAFLERFQKGRKLWYFNRLNVDVTSLLLVSRLAWKNRESN